MKLPTTQYSPVQSLGRWNLATPARAFAAESNVGQSILRAAGGIYDMHQQVEKAEQAERVNGAVAEARLELDTARRDATAQMTHNRQQLRSADIDIGTDADGKPLEQVESHKFQPQLWEHGISQLRNRYTKGMSPAEASAFNKAISGDVRSTTNAVLTDTLSKKNNSLRYHVVDTANTLVDAGDVAGAVEHVQQAVPFTDEEKGTITRKLEIRAENNKINMAIRSNDPEVIQQSLSILTDPQYSGFISEAQRQAAVTDLRRQSDNIRAGVVEENSQRHTQFVSDFVLAVDSGELLENDIERAYEQWQEDPFRPDALDPDERTRLILAARRKHAEDMKTTTGLSLVNRALTGDALLNPANKEHRKAVERYVELNNISDPRKLEAVLTYTGVMPQATQDQIESTAINGTPDQAKYALELYGRLEDTAPHLLHDLDNRADMILSQATVMTRGGVNPVDAIEISRETLRTAPEQREARGQTYKVAEDGEAPDNTAALVDMMADDERLFNVEYTFPFGGADVDPDPQMAVEFDVLTEGYYTINGDLTTSRKMAYNALQKTWSITETGGRVVEGNLVDDPRAMKYAPERIFNISPEQSNASLARFANTVGISPSNTIIYSDATTARIPTSWSVASFNPETGLVDIPIDPVTGQPARWFPGQWLESAKKQLRREAVEKAKQDRLMERQGPTGGSTDYGDVTSQSPSSGSKPDTMPNFIGGFN